MGRSGKGSTTCDVARPTRVSHGPHRTVRAAPRPPRTPRPPTGHRREVRRKQTRPKNGASKTAPECPPPAARARPPRGSSPPPTASGGNQTRPGGQNPTRAAKRPQLEQRDTAKKAAQGPRRLFWRTRAAQAWHPQNRALRVPHLSTPALQSTGGGQVHDRRARWFSLVAFGQVELQETTRP